MPTLCPRSRVNLVFQGGGVKGIGLVGALAVLEPYLEIVGCVGTSAGSIVAALVAAGYQAGELREILYSESLADMVGIDLKTSLLSPLTLFRRGGLYDASRLADWVDDKLRMKLHLENECTFGDLPRPLSVIAADLNGEGAIIFNKEDTPTVRVGWAVKYSSSIPYLFAPDVRDGATLVDGGVVWNNALHIFDSAIQDNEGFPPTLGFALKGTPARYKKNSWFIMNLISAITARRGVDIQEKDRNRVVAIDTHPVGVADFFMTQTDKEYLYHKGRIAAIRFLTDYGTHWNIPVPENPPGPEITPDSVTRRKQLRWAWRLLRIAGACLILSGLLAAAARAWFRAGESYLVETYAGSSQSGNDDAGRLAAKFNGPSGVSVGPSGNVLVADTYNNSVRVIGTAGSVETYCKGEFHDPFDLVETRDGHVYVADLYKHVIRRFPLGVNPLNVKSEVIAGTEDKEGDDDGVPSRSRLSAPMGLALLEDEKLLFVADSGNNSVRWVDLQNNEVHTLIAPLQSEKEAFKYHLDYPQDVKVDKRENGEIMLYIADTFHHEVLKVKVTCSGGKPGAAGIYPLAREGDYYGGTLTAWAALKQAFGASTKVHFRLPYHLAVGPDGDLFVSDYGNGIVWKVREPYAMNLELPNVQHVAGGPGISGPEGFRDDYGSRARFTRPVGLAVSNEGTIYVADDYNNRIRRISSWRLFSRLDNPAAWWLGVLLPGIAILFINLILARIELVLTGTSGSRPRVLHRVMLRSSLPCTLIAAVMMGFGGVFSPASLGLFLLGVGLAGVAWLTQLRAASPPTLSTSGQAKGTGERAVPDPLQAIRDELQSRESDTANQADRLARRQQLDLRLADRFKELISFACNWLARDDRSQSGTFYSDLAHSLLSFNETLREAAHEYPRYRIFERLGRGAQAGVPSLDTAAALLLLEPTVDAEAVAQDLKRIQESRPHDVWSMWLTYILDQLMNSHNPPVKDNVPPDITREQWRKAEAAFGCILFSDETFRVLQDSMNQAGSQIDAALKSGGHRVSNRPHGRVRDLIGRFDARALHWYASEPPPMQLLRPPACIEEITEPQSLRRQLDEVWTAANCLQIALDVWAAWFVELQETGDAHPGVALNCDDMARRAIKVLLAHRPIVEPFSLADETALTAMLPPIPAWWVAGTDVSPNAEQTELIEKVRVRWQEDPEFLDRYYWPPERLQEMASELRSSAARLIGLLKSFPTSAVSTPQSLARPEEPARSDARESALRPTASGAQRATKMIKVLLLSANPIDSPLNIDEEFRAIDQKIRSSEHRDHVDLIKHGAVRLEDIPGLLMRHKPHVVQFSGHGDVSGIVLTGADGTGRLVPPDALAYIFRALKDNVRVVLLNACDSAPQAEAIVSQIDCAVGMSDEIDDDAAIAFAAAFYETLGYGRSVQTAFDLALVQLTGAGADPCLAKLYKRRGVKPSEIILVNPPRPQ
jgi:sugar lactone lactonase YvrE